MLPSLLVHLDQICLALTWIDSVWAVKGPLKETFLLAVLTQELQKKNTSPFALSGTYFVSELKKANIIINNSTVVMICLKCKCSFVKHKR